jgi:hypothetical protein
MKTIAIAIVAYFSAFSANSADTSITKSHSAGSNQKQQSEVLRTDARLAEISQPTSQPTSAWQAMEEKKSALQFNQTMKKLLLIIAIEKHEQAIENLKACKGYNEMMMTMLLKIENDKIEAALLEMEAAASFGQVMSNTLQDAAIK